jgi:hypothetical protein
MTNSPYLVAFDWTNPSVPFDMRAYGDITIICVTAPSTPGKVRVSEKADGSNPRYTALIDGLGNTQKAPTGNSPSVAGTEYSVFVGNCYVWLEGDVGGAYQIKGRA